MNTVRLMLCTLLSLVLGACASAPQERRSTVSKPVEQGPAPAANGSIYASARGQSLFEDNKAQWEGDLLTVVLVERTQASASAATTSSKSQQTAILNPTVLGRGVTVGGNALFGGSLEADRDFSGSGGSQQSNRLDGQLTVRVIERLPGGVLRVEGEKQLQLNQADETLRLRSLVRLQDIGPDNTVLSSRIADAEIEYSGQGAVGDANAMGWLARFFNSAWWPL